MSETEAAQQQKTEQKTLNIKLGNVKGRLTRFLKFLDNFHLKPDYNELATRLEKAELLQEDFDELITQLLLLETGQDYDCDRDEFEENYYVAIAKARSLLDSNPSKQSCSQVNQLNVSTSNTIFDTVRLPPVNLPVFDGSFDKFLQFHDTFKTIIHDNRTLTPSQKFHYLLSSLKGDALQTVQSIQISDQNYFIAWNLICERYKNLRVIINCHIKELFEIPSLNRESKDGLRHILDTCQKSYRSLEALNEPVDEWDSILIFLISMKLDNTTRREWEGSLKDNELPTWKELTDFLTKKCQMLETLDFNSKLSQKPSGSRSFSHFSPANVKCYFCKGNHWLNLCEKFLALSIDSRLNETKKMRLCTNCLRSNHTSKECKSSVCKKCNQRHHTLLHFENNLNSKFREPQPNSPINSNVSIENNNQKIVSTVQQNNEAMSNPTVTLSNKTHFSHVLLSTANVYMYDRNGKPFLCRALLDSGSQSNYITYDLVDKLKIPLKPIDLPVSGISQNIINIKHSASSTVKSIYNSFSEDLNFLVIRNITDNLPSFPINSDTLKIPETIKLADPEFNVSKPVDILLGAGIFYSLLCIGQIKLGDDLPLMQKTHFGWVLSGPIQLNISQKNTICSLNVSNRKVEDQLEKFWLSEECTKNIPKYSQEELECEEHFIKTTTRDKDGRFTVSLPTKDNISNLGESKENAVKRFLNIEKRLNRDKTLKEQYDNFMNEYISLGHMTLVNDKNSTNDKIIFYLPHHSVTKNDSLTTKVRVVFDASAKSNSGLSLNDALKVGPTIQDDLLSIVLRFRTHSYVITSDIEKMYRMVNVTEADKDLQRIVWRSDPEHDLKIYQLNTVTYGTASAPFLAIRSLHQVAYDNLKLFPQACEIILRDFYVDDLIFGTSSVTEGIKLKNEISKILESAGFQLRKWASNDKTILELEHNIENLPNYFISDDKNIKTLGIIWDPNRDTLNYSGNISNKVGNKITKRIILAIISQIFDPLGLLGPVIMRAKLILQELWKHKLEWDESVPIHIHTLFTDLYKQLQKINQISIPRHVLLNNYSNFAIHAFCDASLLAYGACVYLVSQDTEGNYYSQLLCAKSRIAPIKSITLPRLELCGALLLAQLVNKVITALRHLSTSNFYFWTDSTIVLSWFSIPPNNLKIFVANRVTEILSLTNIENWHHVKSKDNPADIISRGMNPDDLTKCDLWWNGPKWLLSDPACYPTQCDQNISKIPELKKDVILSLVTINDFTILDKFSSLSKLKRVLAYCMRFINNIKNKNCKLSGSLTIEELDNSLLTLIKIAQARDFADEIINLQKSNSVKPKSRLASLDPFLDEGIIRVGGRLKNSKLSYTHKHPVVLSNKNPLSKLIIKFEHTRLMHAGTQAVLTSLRSQFWILNGKNTVKGVIRKCIVCFKADPKIPCPKMGNLPASRVCINRPFSISGVDLAGPFLVKDGKTRCRKVVKCYLCVFVCFTTKAAHLELVSDMSLEAFLNALKRFISRRGIPHEIHSDNGSNFKAAANELSKIYSYMRENGSENIQNFLHENKIKWVFIPPRSPHFGGLWEACVKSTKFHLKRILGNAHLTFEQLYTIIVQIEGILNSRPITPLSNDPHDYEPLTPAHFLIGDKITSLPQHDVERLPSSSRNTTYQRLRQIIQHFWSRWRNEYLCGLQQRFKWKQQSSDSQLLKSGMMVLVKEDGIGPSHWKIGRIMEVFPGDDNQVRVVTIRTKNGVIKRSFSKVCPLPTDF